ncbi:MAG: hypothetical protein JRG96_04185 [Deltaproteobacteria bacterium]|nr:hypothetical protein [Deltaproteobacteria bacterium]MBW2417455.1 hypothetical protein [Deltaproteobacteria bacterium]
MLGRIASLALIVVLAGAGFMGFRLLATGLEARVYRARLEELGADYDALREQYNRAVRKTAVTELVVEDGKLAIAIRTGDGALQRFDTPFDPSKEIYVDYVVVGGRLWIRRIFDEDTAPGSGMMIDPRFVDVNWSDEDAHHGKAAYRELEEGVWVVSVTGDGSLGLARREEGETGDLAAAPPVRSYAPVEEEVEAALRDIEAGELLQGLAQALRLREHAAR